MGEWRYGSTIFLTSVLGGGEWSTSRPHRFTRGEGVPGIHWIGGSVGPIAGLDVVDREKSVAPAGYLLSQLVIFVMMFY
jgi:hypothetical protein